MKRILCFLTVASLTMYFSSWTISSDTIASEKKSAEETQKADKNIAKDIVCGMDVHKDKALKLKHDGKTYYFCSKGCEDTFKKDPSKYAKKENKQKGEKETKGKGYND